MTRREGTTTQAMLRAPHGAVYVWSNEATAYPRQLAEKLGRHDLKIVGPDWLRFGSWHGTEPSGIELDHACRLDTLEWRAFEDAKSQVRMKVMQVPRCPGKRWPATTLIDRSATKPKAMRAAMEAHAHHDLLVRNTLCAARNEGMNTEQTMTWLAYNALIRAEDLERKLMDEMYRRPAPPIVWMSNPPSPNKWNIS
jgi:hypothetical protein